VRSGLLKNLIKASYPALIEQPPCHTAAACRFLHSASREFFCSWTLVSGALALVPRPSHKWRRWARWLRTVVPCERAAWLYSKFACPPKCRHRRQSRVQLRPSGYRGSQGDVFASPRLSRLNISAFFAAVRQLQVVGGLPKSARLNQYHPVSPRIFPALRP
jgi:hypothetical protein